MFERAAQSIIATCALAVAAGMAVVAAGFALYSFLLEWMAPSAASACVAGVSAISVAIYGWLRHKRSEVREAAKNEPRGFLPQMAEALKEHPMAALGLSALVGLLAARNPGAMGEIAKVANSVLGAK